MSDWIVDNEEGLSVRGKLNGLYDTVMTLTGYTTLNSLLDVVISGASNGDVLTYYSSNWINSGITDTISITNIIETYTGLTSDNYIRCSGETGQTYDIYLPSSTGSGRVLYIKNKVDGGTITVYGNIDASNNVSLDYNYNLTLIDSNVDQWDVINLYVPV